MGCGNKGCKALFFKRLNKVDAVFQGLCPIVNARYQMRVHIHLKHRKIHRLYRLGLFTKYVREESQRC